MKYTERKFPHKSRASFLFSVIFGLDFAIRNKIFTFLCRQVIAIPAFLPVHKEKVSKIKAKLLILTKEDR